MDEAVGLTRVGIRVSGIVQGVGFRPFVYRLATACFLAGFVLNDEQGVWLELQGDSAAVERFIGRLRADAPPLSVIVEVQVTHLPLVADAGAGFAIHDSQASATHETLISPDIATCSDCQREIADPANRRYRYAFTNCTNCGPRYSIVKDVPYDRAKTTMAGFSQCAHCLAEYKDVADRRFHAQPNACVNCGPQYRLMDKRWQALAGDAPAEAARQIRGGAIVAIKGIGGYHLVCDARNAAAVNELRRRKRRAAKPLAVMGAALSDIRQIGVVSTAAENLLGGTARPIVLLEKSPAYDLADGVAPATQYIGAMLPYAPLHFIMMQAGDVWVMTSANYSELPLVYQDSAAKDDLAGLADYFLVHNRRIYCRVDDSVARIFAGKPYLIRRSRGLAPSPIYLPQSGESILAVGGEQKNTFCLTKGRAAFVSTHIGDLENMAVFDAYRELIAHDRRLFGVVPTAVACDLHPDYLSTKYAKSLALPAMAVQHHHAHIVSVLLEHGEFAPVIGVAFDGTGYGEDGHLWGGEFMIADCRSFRRLAQFAYLPLPGGAQAIRQPWRQAAWLLKSLYGDDFINRNIPLNKALPDTWPLVLDAAASGLNSPLTSSAGRLFDAAAALLGLCTVNQYDGQAAVALELAANHQLGQVLPYDMISGATRQIDFAPAFAALAARAADGEASGKLAADFHTTMAAVIITVVKQISRRSKIKKVALSGGVFQNVLLLKQVLAGLNPDFTVLLNRQVPPNDGGLSLGQAGIVRERMR